MTEKTMVLGAMLFGTSIPEDRSFDLLDRFVDGGGTVIDTANCYAFWASPTGSGGQSEETIGRWLSRRPGMRDRISLSTKVGCEPTGPGEYPASAEGLSAPVVRQAVRDSLRRLGTDHVDLYWAHREDRHIGLEETVSAFGEVVSDGLAVRLGASNHALWRVERARRIAEDHGLTGFTAIQQRYSYVHPRPFETLESQDHRFGWVTDETLDYTQSHREVDLWAYTPLLNGSFDRTDRPFAEQYRHRGTDRRMAALAEVAAETGASRGQVVLAWLIGGTPAVTPIVGVSSVEQLDQALAGSRLELTEDQRTRLDTA